MKKKCIKSKRLSLQSYINILCVLCHLLLTIFILSNLFLSFLLKYNYYNCCKNSYYYNNSNCYSYNNSSIIFTFTIITTTLDTFFCIFIWFIFIWKFRTRSKTNFLIIFWCNNIEIFVILTIFYTLLIFSWLNYICWKFFYFRELLTSTNWFIIETLIFL